MSEEPPKRRRRLQIVDVPGDGTDSFVPPPVAQAAPKPQLPPEPIIDGPGPVHARMQREVLEMCIQAKGDVDDIDPHVWKRVDSVLAAKSRREAEELSKNIMANARIHFIQTTKHPEKQAKAAERISKMWRTKGEDGKADAQLAKAKQIRAQIAAEANAKAKDREA